MVMSKKLMAFAATGAFILGSAGMASATVDMDSTPTGAIDFEQRVTIPAGGTGIVGASSGLDVIRHVGFSIADGTSKYVRLSWTNAQVGVALTLADFSITTASTVDTPTVAVSSAGLAGDDYVIVEIAAVGADIQQTDIFGFDFDTNGDILAMTMAQSDITYELYETAVDAVNQTNELDSQTTKWYGFADGLTYSCTSVNTDKIDVVTPTQFLGTPGNSNIFTATLGVVTGVFNIDDGAQVTIDDYTGAATVLTVGGEMTGIGAADWLLADEAGADEVSVISTVNDTATVTGVTFTAADGSGSLLLPMGSEVFDLTPDGVNAMTPSTYDLTVTVDAAGANKTYLAAGSTLDFGTCATTLYSGSTDRMDFALTPGGIFKNYVRITNPSGTTGNVVLQVWADDGSTASFNLSDIAGQSTNSLAAYASTTLITVEDVYAAAQAANAAFAVGSGGKLRIQVRGEFGDDAVDGNTPTATSATQRLTDGIVIQGLTTSRDNNAFFMMKN
jgi:hypothetical protein